MAISPTADQQAPAPAASARAQADDLVLAAVADHAASLLALARRYSYCVDDAHDAYQRALEILIRRAALGTVPDGIAGWLHTIVKHEALAVRRERGKLVGAGACEPDREEARHLEPIDDRAASFERLERSAEALQRLKPQEMRALMLKAHGYSYAEIGDITGWTYTKVNRCLTEGRRAFMDRYDAIASGRECDRFSALLSTVADGEADAADVAALRPHLRHCTPCRARLRECRQAPGGVASLIPAGLVAGGRSNTLGGWRQGIVNRIGELLAGGLHERAAISAHKLQAGLEAATTGKLAVVAASAAAVAGGGAAVVGPLDDEDTGRRATRSVVHVRRAAERAPGPQAPSRAVVVAGARTRSATGVGASRRAPAHFRTVARRPRGTSGAAGEFDPSGAGQRQSPVASAGAAGGPAAAPTASYAPTHSTASVHTAAPASEPAAAAEFVP